MRLTLLCAGATASSRIGAFPSATEPLDEGGMRKAETFRLHGPTPDLILCSPHQAAIETARAIGVEVQIEPRIGDQDFGEWSGRTMTEIHGASPERLGMWLADPAEAPPGGEAIARLVERMGAVIDRLGNEVRSATLITHAMPMRAAIMHTLPVPLAAAIRFDLPPLSTLLLFRSNMWRLQELRLSNG
jgi:broad specificity phosphatase PhoE